MWSDERVVAVRRASGLLTGHTVVLLRRHGSTYFESTPDERQALWTAVDAVKLELDEQLSPAGYSIRLDTGAAADPAVMHAQLHVFPRFEASRAWPSLPRFVHGEDDHLIDALRRAMVDAQRVEILASFIQPSGLQLLEDDLVDALERGAQVKVLTGDYLRITSPNALQTLLRWSQRYDNLDARLFLTEDRRVFHPKAYLFSRGTSGVAFVGSSNLSRSALTDGVEWSVTTNLDDAETFATLRDRFAYLFEPPRAQPLTRALVEEYRSRWHAPAPPSAEALAEPPAPAPTPHAVQREVLDALARARAAGQARGMVVLATGLGKTLLSAFDFAATGGARALFVAHRAQILEQAADSWARLFPERSIGFVAGGSPRVDADIVFASVQTLSRDRSLRSFAPDHFQYIVIDEFHHAAASSYRKLLGHFTPKFLLGLTATPDRTDGASLLDLCDGHEVCRVDLLEGIRRGLLVPFRYYGVKDELDFEPIPWRSGRFDPEALTSAVATRDRAAQALREYRKHAPADGRCALVFCCSTAHADFMAAYLSEHGVRAASVHSGPTAAARAESLRKLRLGQLEAICAVDVFNEGLDVPDINTILMLRPTESSVIFMQQLGRGLRKSPATGKEALTVVDFIGNHRAFSVKPTAVLRLLGRSEHPASALRVLGQGAQLPDGCSIDIETEAIEALLGALRPAKEDELRRAYLSFVGAHGRRPAASELFRAGVRFRAVRQRYGTWFDYLDEQGDLEVEEQEVLRRWRGWFDDLHRVRLVDSLGVVALVVLCRGDGMHEGIALDGLVDESVAFVRGDPVLRTLLDEFIARGLNALRSAIAQQIRRTIVEPKGATRLWFTATGGQVRLAIDVAEERRSTFDSMTYEVIDLLLDQCRGRQRRRLVASPQAGPIPMVVSSSGNKAILRFRRGDEGDDSIPRGEVPVYVDGERVLFKFVDIAVNVARRPTASGEGRGPNILTELMHRWYGRGAGQPGRHDKAELHQRDDGAWELRPTATVAESIPVLQLPYFEDLRVACGLAESSFEESGHATMIEVQTARFVDERHHFVVRASGESMNGGVTPILDRDLVLIERMTVSDPQEVEGRPVLLAGGRASETVAYIKIPVLVEGRWVLRSANTEVPDVLVEPDVELRVVGKVVEVVTEESTTRAVRP